MADNLTTPRKLNQINWSKGMTDKDIRPGFVSELLNVEIVKGDRVESRDSLEFKTTTSYGVDNTPHAFVRINGDPSGNYPDGWIMIITNSIIRIMDINGHYHLTPTVEFDLPFDIDLDSIEAVIVGSAIYIASSYDGEPNPVIAIAWSAFDERFTSPLYIDETSPEYGTTSKEGQWTLIELNDRPVLDVFVNEDITGDVIARQATLERANEATNSNNFNSVSLFVETQFNDSYCDEVVKYDNSISMQFVIVFKYVDGSLSMPSTPFALSLNRDGKFNVGYTIIVNENISNSIGSVLLYRKILDTELSLTGGHDLIIDAPLKINKTSLDTFKTSDIEDGYWIMTCAESSYSNFPDYKQLESQTNFGEKIYYHTVDGYAWVHCLIRSATIIIDDLFNEVPFNDTLGWIASGNYRMFIPMHYYSEGTAVVKHYYYDHSGMELITNHENSLRITDRIQISVEGDSLASPICEYIDAMIVGGAFGASVFAEFDFGFSENYKIACSYTDVDGSINNGNNDTIDKRGFLRIGTTTVESNTHTGTPIINEIPQPQFKYGASFALFRDMVPVTVAPSLETEFGGVDFNDVVDVKPFHIGAAGGRLFALNLKADGILKPAELMYTEQGRLGSFIAPNYISYGIRDDGIGVGISNIKSFVLAHHTSATYVFDISGGSDFVWREIGGYKDTGCIKKDLICTTPYGVFWCGYSNLHAFNGRSVESISDEIFKTYRAFVPDCISLQYREDLKQLWLCSRNKEVLVYDMQSASWHKHNFDGLYPWDDFGVKTIYSIGSDLYAKFDSHYSDGKGHYKIDGEGETFDWGIDTGYDTMGIPEIIKKLRRVYLYAIRDDEYTNTDRYVSIETFGDEGGQTAVFDSLIDDKQVRQSASVRGYATRIKVMIRKGESFWKGKIDSLGLSYKPKKLK